MRVCRRGGRRRRSTGRVGGASQTRELAVIKRDRALMAGVSVRHEAVRFDVDTTVGVLVDAWLSTVARHRMRVSTFEQTTKRLGRLGELRQLPVGELTTETLTQWQSKLLDRLAPRTVVGTRTSVKDRNLCHQIRRTVRATQNLPTRDPRVGGST
jgi:hypothetical protein